MLPPQLISIFSFVILLLPPPFSTGLVAKPGCPDRCGNLSIPYPFGVGSECSLEPSFNISCNSSTGHPKAYITILDKEVIEINETYVRVKYPNYLASACYGLSDYKPYGKAVNLSGTPFTLSSENWLTAIGCDDMVVGTGPPNGTLVCASLCAERNDTGGIGYCPDNGLWSILGNGCCRYPITKGRWPIKEISSHLSWTEENDEPGPSTDESNPELQLRGPVTRLRAKKLQGYFQCIVRKKLEDEDVGVKQPKLVNLTQVSD